MIYRKRFVIGDIHGAYKALMQCLSKAEFSYEQDLLICLGDVCDGWPETNSIYDELLKIKNVVYILGNHDYYTLQWALSGVRSTDWLKQGGYATLDSYAFGIPKSHIHILKTARLYYILENKLFVHGGILLNKNIEEQGSDIFLWDRSMIETAMKQHVLNPSARLTAFDEIFIGHTPTVKYDIYQPEKFCEIWMIDTGAGWHGSLSMMNIDTKECFISEQVQLLYPKHKGRM